MSRAQQNTTNYTYTTVPAGYTSTPSSIQPLPPTIPQLSVTPPPAISILLLPKPTIPPNSKSIPLAQLPLPPMPLMEVLIPIPLEEEPLTMSLAEVPNKPMLPELPTDRAESTRPLLRRSQLRAESSIFLSRRSTLSTSKSRRSTKFQLRLRSSSTRRLSAMREFPMREPSLTTMPLRLKLSTSVEKSRRP